MLFYSFFKKKPCGGRHGTTNIRALEFELRNNNFVCSPYPSNNGLDPCRQWTKPGCPTVVVYARPEPYEDVEVAYVREETQYY